MEHMGGKTAYISAFVDDKGLELLVTLPTGATVHLSYVPRWEMVQGQGFMAWLNTHIHDINTHIHDFNTHIHDFNTCITTHRQSTQSEVNMQASKLYDVLFCRGHDVALAPEGIVARSPHRGFARQQGLFGGKVHQRSAVLLTAGSSQQNLLHVPRRNWRVLGAGASQERIVDGIRFDALTGARTEMQDLIHDPQNGFTGGVLPGRVLVDDQFTNEAFVGALHPQYSRSLFVVSGRSYLVAL